MQVAAHNMMLSNAVGFSSHIDFTFSNVVGVIGRRGLEVVACLAPSRFMPLNTCSSFTISLMCGSFKPDSICSVLWLISKILLFDTIDHHEQDMQQNYKVCPLLLVQKSY